MRKFAWVLAIASIGGIAVSSTLGVVSIPMNSQINLGYTYNTQSPSGNAIYPAFNSDTQAFTGGAGGFVRHNMTGATNSWWYQYVDLNLAGITTPGAGVDVSSPTATIEFDVRYYQDFETNPRPYSDAPVFLRIYNYGADGNTHLANRDYSIVYATQAPWNNPSYPAWTHVVVNVNGAAHTDSGAFNAANVSRIRWYGTDWAGTGFDFVDIRNLVITPEPASLVLLALGGLAVMRRRHA
jgi:hypothetical protein